MSDRQDTRTETPEDPRPAFTLSDVGRWWGDRDNRTRLRKVVFRPLWFIPTLIGAGLGLFAQELYSKHFKPEYVIAVVGPVSGQDTSLWGDVLEGARYAAQTLDLEGVQLRCYDDRGESERAVDIARLLVDDPSVLAVVGPCQSTVAEAALPIYRKSWKPVLMPVPTNPALTETRCPNGNVFRLPPTDKEQARCIVKAVKAIRRDAGHLEKHEKAMDHHGINLFREERNKVYSGFLAHEVRSRLEDSRETAGANNYDDWSTLPEVMVDGVIGLPGNGIHVGGVLPEITSCMTIYAGFRDNALTLLRQCQDLEVNHSFILSDGCVDGGLLALGARVLEGAYVTFPYCPPQHTPGRARLGRAGNGSATDPPEWLTRPTYAAYGYDAIKILSEALLATETTSSRRLVQEIRRRSSHDVADFEGLAANYRFDANGDSTRQGFHLWKIVSTLPQVEDRAMTLEAGAARNAANPRLAVQRSPESPALAPLRFEHQVELCSGEHR